MRKKNGRKNGLSRRAFLKAGICGFGLAAVFSAGRSSAGASQTALSRGAQKGLLMPARSKWFSKIGNNKVRCELCPRGCEPAEGKRGFCRVRENRNGEGYTLVSGNPVLIQEDPIERKPFFHVIPASRTLSVSTAGCNLACKFCEVWDMAQAEPEELFAYRLPPQAVVEQALAAGVRSVSYAFGEPVVFYEYMARTAVRAANAGLLNLMHTAGYIRPRPLKEIIPRLDAVNVDLKSFDAEFYREVVGGELGPVLETLKTLKKEGIHIEITSIVIPTLNDSPDTINRMCKWIVNELGPDVPLHFARFYPLYKLSGLPRTPVSALDRARETALKQGIKFVYVSRVPGHEAENTFCPACGKKIISRLGFWVDEVRLQNGKCGYCGAAIAGRWK